MAPRRFSVRVILPAFREEILLRRRWIQREQSGTATFCAAWIRVAVESVNERSGSNKPGAYRCYNRQEPH